MVFITKCPPSSPPFPSPQEPKVSLDKPRYPPQVPLPRANPRPAPRPQTHRASFISPAGGASTPSLESGILFREFAGKRGLGQTKLAISASTRSAPGNPPMLSRAEAHGKGGSPLCWGGRGSRSAAVLLFRACERPPNPALERGCGLSHGDEGGVVMLADAVETPPVCWH